MHYRKNPTGDQFNNRCVGTESGHMNNDELNKFIETITVEHTQDQPAAWLIGSLGYQHNNRTIDICNKHSITVYRVPQQKVRHRHKLDRQSIV